MRPLLRSALILALIAAPALAQAPQQKLDRTIGALKQSRQQEEKIERQLSATQTDLKQMRTRATDLAADLQSNEARAQQAERELARLNKNLSRTEKEFEARKEEYAHTIASLLRMKSLPPTALFSNKESATELMRTSRVLRNTNEALATRARALKEESDRLARLKREVGQSRTRVEREQASLGEKQKQLAADLATRQRLQDKLARDHRVAQAEVSQLSRESESLQELIGKLERQPRTGRSTPAPSSTLRWARGRAQLPVVGQLTHGFGEHKNDNETYRGMVLATRPRAAVVAPYGGEVVFTGPFMDYGSMVLLKHGDGFISLLAGLGSISVGLNQQLAKGEPIGAMPGSKPSLYVELRERSKPIDPAQWFAKLPRR